MLKRFVFICILLDIGTSCPNEDWIYSSYNDMCFLLLGLKLSRSEAKQHCSSLESDLLSPDTRQQYEFIKDVYNQQPWHLFPPWIDLDFGFSEFLWNGHRRADFTAWLKNEPSDTDQCVVWRTLENSVSVDGWKSLECKYEQPVVCQQPSKTCKTQVFTASYGELTSQAFPRNYDNNLSCYYHILARPGFRVTLMIREFYTEFSRDILSIYDGGNTSKLLARYILKLDRGLYLFQQKWAPVERGL